MKVVIRVDKNDLAAARLGARVDLQLRRDLRRRHNPEVTHRDALRRREHQVQCAWNKIHSGKSNRHRRAGRGLGGIKADQRWWRELRMCDPAQREAQH